MASLFESLKDIGPNEAGLAKLLLQSVLGLPMVPLVKEVAITPEIQNLLEERENARKEKDWARSDALRDRLRQLGFEVKYNQD